MSAAPPSHLQSKFCFTYPFTWTVYGLPPIPMTLWRAEIVVCITYISFHINYSKIIFCQQWTWGTRLEIWECNKSQDTKSQMKTQQSSDAVIPLTVLGKRGVPGVLKKMCWSTKSVTGHFPVCPLLFFFLLLIQRSLTCSIFCVKVDKMLSALNSGNEATKETMTQRVKELQLILRKSHSEWIYRHAHICLDMDRYMHNSEQVIGYQQNTERKWTDPYLHRKDGVWGWKEGSLKTEARFVFKGSEEFTRMLPSL